jgi:hypothetical protein
MIVVGKMLVRKAKTLDGKECLIICGSFYAPKEALDALEGDEMWITKISVGDAIKFSEPIKEFSPEEFLEGEPQKESFWKTRNRKPIR